MPHLVPETPPDFDQTRVTERPDGFYWQEKTGGREYGPFDTLLEAVQDMQQSDESTFEPGETADEARAEIGIADWIDPDTGEPAEEGGTRTEEH
ncbi:MAG: hypothetical protein ACXW2I_03115 [Burkholderiales bacterium]